MRILVTNDDGIDSTGLHVLARHLVPLGDVVVVAPDREYSGFGAALGVLHEMHPEVREAEIDGVPKAWSVCGPPGLCIFFARLGVFGDVDLVVSGINPGVNTGRAIYHSGTVGATLTARNGSMSGIAVSQDVTGHGVEGQAWDEMLVGQQWDTAAEVAATAARALIADLPPEPVVVNLNVPNTKRADLAGWQFGEVGMTPLRSVAAARLEPREGHPGAYHVEMEWGETAELPPETDGGAVERGFVSVTFLNRFEHQPDPRLGGIGAALDDLLA